MSIRYVLAPEAAVDLVQIWGYIKQKVDVEMADRVEAVIREKILFLAKTPGAGHWRKDARTCEVLLCLFLPYRLPS